MEPTKEQAKDDGDTETKLKAEDLKPIRKLKDAVSVLQQHYSSSNENYRNVNLKRQSIVNYYLHAHLHGKNASTSKADASVSTVSSAGAALQRTQLVFAVDWNPANLARSWEVPVEKSHAATSLHSSALSKLSPVTPDLIQAMQEKQNGKWHTVTMPQGEEQDSKKATNVQENSDPSVANATNGNVAAEEEDSEDDIFPDVGDDSP